MKFQVGKFQLGQVVATPGALTTFTKEEVVASLFRHMAGDWGDVCKKDAKLNDEALKEGSRVLSSYEFHGCKLWVITEADRSATTFLLPEEY